MINETKPLHTFATLPAGLFASFQRAGQFRPHTDRLIGRLVFELFVEHGLVGQ